MPLSDITGPCCINLKTWECADAKGSKLMEFGIASGTSGCFEMAVGLDPQSSTYRHGQHAR